MRISDWSSDVCSSDLIMINPSLQRQFAGEILGGEGGFHFSGVARNRRSGIDIGAVEATQRERFRNALGRQEFLGRQRCSEGRITVEGRAVEAVEIGRASCRERVCQYV